MDPRYAKVFKPGTSPGLTSVTRQPRTMGYTYEERLRQVCLSKDILRHNFGAAKIGNCIM